MTSSVNSLFNSESFLFDVLLKTQTVHHIFKVCNLWNMLLQARSIYLNAIVVSEMFRIENFKNDGVILWEVCLATWYYVF